MEEPKETAEETKRRLHREASLVVHGSALGRCELSLLTRAPLCAQMRSTTASSALWTREVKAG